MSGRTANQEDFFVWIKNLDSHIEKKVPSWMVEPLQEC